MTDEDIDAAITSDPDTWAIGDEELKPMPEGGHYQIYRDEAGAYRWRLVSADGSIVANSARGFQTRRQTEEAITSLRSLVLSARSKAA